MSQGDLATALSVDRAYISNIENGRMNPTLSTLEKISNALGISSSELFEINLWQHLIGLEEYSTSLVDIELANINEIS